MARERPTPMDSFRARMREMNPILDYGNDSNRFLAISFVGGPYDGHAEVRYARVHSLPENVIWLVGGDVCRLLDGEDLSQRSRVAKPITSVALYVLERANGKNVYRFSGSVCIDRLKRGLNE